MKLFVANLPMQCTEDELRDHFVAHGCGEPKSVKIILDRDTGRSRGFGFIEMESAEAGQKAIEELNDKDFGGRTLAVREALDKERRPSREGGGNDRGRRW